MIAKRRRALPAVLLAAAIAQSCVLEPLDAERDRAQGGQGGQGGEGSMPRGGFGDAPGTGGSSGASAGAPISGQPSVAGSAGSLPGMASPGAGGSGAGGNDSGASGGNDAGGAAGSADGGSGGTEPPVDWIKCDPSFTTQDYYDCPSVQPKLGSSCDNDVFYPEDLCTYCENPSACPVTTRYVAESCVDGKWQVTMPWGVGCCPEAMPAHGAACSGDVLDCFFGDDSEPCSCVEGTWQCCGSPYAGDSCVVLNQECLVAYSPDEIDRCSCNGPSAAQAVWDCCPSVTPRSGTDCSYYSSTCVYDDKTCVCNTSGPSSLWSCE